jgi:hypothetical protein
MGNFIKSWVVKAISQRKQSFHIHLCTTFMAYYFKNQHDSRLGFKKHKLSRQLTIDNEERNAMQTKQSVKK